MKKTKSNRLSDIKKKKSGEIPGVVFTADDIINNRPIFTDSRDLPHDEYVKKHSKYYELHPEEK